MRPEAPHPRSSRRSWIVAPALTLVLVACTRASVPVPAGVRLPTATPESPAATPTAPAPTDEPASGTYVVVWVSPGSTLEVRQPAGIAGSVVGELPADGRGIRVTGNSTLLGSSLWVELALPDEGRGWVNSWYLAEEVGRDAFCSDPRVPELVEDLLGAVAARDAASLAALASPRRGLVLRHDWANPDVQIAPMAIPDLFDDATPIEWGIVPGTEFTIEGSFVDVFLPRLDAVLSPERQVGCAGLPGEGSLSDLVWPPELAGMHHVAVWVPTGSGPSRPTRPALAVGVEVVEGKPYVAVVIVY